MKSLVYHGVHDIRHEDVPDPVLADAGSVLVRIAKCGLCGSDLHPYNAGSASTGFCIGHEAVGEVVEAGREVRKFKPGDRVLIAGSISCGACDMCLAGRAMTCRNSPICRVLGQGQEGLGGCQAEAIAVPAADHNLYPLPAGWSDALGIMLTDNLATGWASSKLARVRPGASAMVIGLGAVGLQAVLAALAQGAERVFAVDPIAERRARAASFGAEVFGGDNTLEQVREATHGQGVDCVIDAVGMAKTVELGLLATRRGGNMSVVGLPETPSVPFPLITGIVRNVTLAMSGVSVQAELPDLYAALDQGTLDAAKIEGLVTHDMPLDEGPEAYALFDAKRDGAIKVLMTP